MMGLVEYTISFSRVERLVCNETDGIVSIYVEGGFNEFHLQGNQYANRYKRNM
jgi:hypothetical protein